MSSCGAVPLPLSDALPEEDIHRCCRCPWAAHVPAARAWCSSGWASTVPKHCRAAAASRLGSRARPCRCGCVRLARPLAILSAPRSTTKVQAWCMPVAGPKVCMLHTATATACVRHGPAMGPAWFNGFPPCWPATRLPTATHHKPHTQYTHTCTRRQQYRLHVGTQQRHTNLTRSGHCLTPIIYITRGNALACLRAPCTLPVLPAAPALMADFDEYDYLERQLEGGAPAPAANGNGSVSLPPPPPLPETTGQPQPEQDEEPRRKDSKSKDRERERRSRSRSKERRRERDERDRDRDRKDKGGRDDREREHKRSRSKEHDRSDRRREEDKRERERGRDDRRDDRRDDHRR